MARDLGWIFFCVILGFAAGSVIMSVLHFVSG